jgi:hypothetical protein
MFLQVDLDRSAAGQLSRHSKFLNPRDIQFAFIPQFQETGSQEQILFSVRKFGNEYFGWRIWLMNIQTNARVRQLPHDVQQILLHWPLPVNCLEALLQ